MYRPDLVYEVTSSTLSGSFALRPCSESTERIVGVIGRALALFPSIRIHALNPLSTHTTELISASEPKQIPAYIDFTKTNISKEIGALHGLREGVFSKRRASVLPIAPDEASLKWRLRYVLAQGTKEDLIESPRDWPGVTGVHALERGEALVGWWFDRTAEAKARGRGETFNKYDYGTQYLVPLTPLPCWDGLSSPAQRAMVTETIEEIVATEGARRAAERKAVLGPAAVMAFSPSYIPEKLERSPAPRVLAASATAHRALRRVLGEFCTSFWESSERLLAGALNVEFPAFSFPPGRRMTEGEAVPLDLAFALAPG